MTALIHPGAVIHCWDHLVITLRDDGGRVTAFLSLYAIAYSKSLGAGTVALLEIDAQGVGPVAVTLTDDPGLGQRQQERLRAMGDERMLRAGPAHLARFEREPYGPTGFGYRIHSDVGELHARWDDPDEPFWVEGQGGSFSPTEDIWAMFVSARTATLTLDGISVPGAPFDDDVWVPKLGRSVSSAHGAFAEVRVEPAGATSPLNDRATGSAPDGPR